MYLVYPTRLFVKTSESLPAKGISSHSKLQELNVRRCAQYGIHCTVEQLSHW